MKHKTDMTYNARRPRRLKKVGSIRGQKEQTPAAQTEQHEEEKEDAGITTARGKANKERTNDKQQGRRNNENEKIFITAMIFNMCPRLCNKTDAVTFLHPLVICFLLSSITVSSVKTAAAAPPPRQQLDKKTKL